MFKVIESGFYRYTVDDNNKTITRIDDIEWCQVEIDIYECIDAFIEVSNLRIPTINEISDDDSSDEGFR